jgi:Transposase DDE domain
MSSWQLPPEVASAVALLALVLDARQRGRFAALAVGLLFAKGRRTVTSWLRAGGLSPDFRACYRLAYRLGRRAERLAVELFVRVVLPRLARRHRRLLFALDDTPTRRYGPCVEGAGVHHNPTPGPAGQQFVYGHVWVTLAWLARHPWWGAIALPLRACLYIRQKDVAALPKEYRWEFRTKLALAAGLIQWLARWAAWCRKPLWLACDGAYATRAVLRAALAAGVTVVSRLRQNAALWALPPAGRPKGKRGRRPIYGSRRLSLAKRAGQKRGWQRGEFVLYGEAVVKTYKTFLATWRPAGGAIRVVLVKEPHGWRAYFSTAAAASVADILEAVAERFSIETCFHQLKEIWGVGQQQVRNVWASIGALHLSLWLHTLVELWAWDRAGQRLVDRRASPWDDPDRRPSHADRRRALQRDCLRQEYQAAGHGRGQAAKYRALAKRLLRLVA